MEANRRACFASVILALGIAGLLLLSAASAFAAAVVEDWQGDVRIGATLTQSRPVLPRQSVPSGSLVTTAAGSRVVLRFDDGQVAALHENTQFRIGDFRYRLQEPAADSAAFVLLRGALRIVTGAMGHRNPKAFSLRTSQAMIGVRGTDFMVAIENSAYLSVLQGTIVATNAAGTATFAAGAFGAVASHATLAASIHANALPDAALSAFGNLGALRFAPAASSAAGAAGKIKLPEGALPQAQEPAAFGRDTADRARELKEELDREFGKETSGAARERARDLSPNSRSGSRLP